MSESFVQKIKKSATTGNFEINRINGFNIESFYKTNFKPVQHALLGQRTEEFIKHLSTEKSLHFACILSKMTQVRKLTHIFFQKQFQRSRKSCYRKRGCLFEYKSEQGPFRILLIESDSWPVMSSLRVQITPNESLDYSQNGCHSLWTFLASTASNGQSYDQNLSLAFNCLGMRYNQTDAKEVYDVFKIGVAVEIWLRNPTECNKIASLIRPRYQKTALLRHYASNLEQLQSIYHYCPTKKEYMRSSIEPQDAQFTCSIKTVFYCNFANCNCYYFEESQFISHQQTCVNREEFAPKVTYKCNRMNQYKAGEELLIALGHEYFVEHYSCFDIETVQEASSNSVNKQNQTLVSISVKKSWAGEAICLTRTNSESGSGYELVTKFIEYLDKAHAEYQNRFADFGRIRNKLERYATKWGINKSYEVEAAFKLIDDMERLKVLGFNSERFDVPELYPYLCSYFGVRNIQFDVIKRGNGKLRIQ